VPVGLNTLLKRSISIRYIYIAITVGELWKAAFSHFYPTGNLTEVLFFDPLVTSTFLTELLKRKSMVGGIRFYLKEYASNPK
jgi:hypothetical protein